MENLQNGAKSVQNLIKMHLCDYLEANRTKYPHWLVLSFLSAAAIVVASTWITIMHPAIGEIITGIAVMSFSIIAAICIVFFGLFIAYNFFRAGVDTFQQAKDAAPKFIEPAKPAVVIPAIPVEVFSAPPDILVYQKPGEPLAEYVERAKAAKADSVASVWVAVVPFQESEAAIYTGPDESDVFIFSRMLPPFSTEPEIAANHDFRTETEAQYVAYLRWFTDRFSRWSSAEKLRVNEGRAGRTILETLAEKAKHSANVALFILLSVSAIFAQSKTRQVDNILGTRIREIPPAGADVSFIFEGDKTYNRIGDGKSDYTSLLQKSPGIGKFNDEGGVLIAVTKDGEVIAKAARAERVNATPSTKAEQMRPVPVDDAPPVAVMDKPAFAVPDSLEMAYMAENVRVEFDKAGRQAVSAARPWFDTLNFIFMWLYPLLLLVGGVSYLWAFVAAKQGMYDTHRVSMQAFTWVALITATVVLINMLVFAFSFDLHPAVLTLIAAAEVGLIVYITHKVSPDFRPSRGNDNGEDIFTPVNSKQRRIG